MIPDAYIAIITVVVIGIWAAFVIKGIINRREN